METRNTGYPGACIHRTIGMVMTGSRQVPPTYQRVVHVGPVEKRHVGRNTETRSTLWYKQQTGEGASCQKHGVGRRWRVQGETEASFSAISPADTQRTGLYCLEFASKTLRTPTPCNVSCGRVDPRSAFEGVHDRADASLFSRVFKKIIGQLRLTCSWKSSWLLMRVCTLLSTKWERDLRKKQTRSCWSARGGKLHPLKGPRRWIQSREQH